jgi:hypothetical protein
MCPCLGTTIQWTLAMIKVDLLRHKCDWVTNARFVLSPHFILEMNLHACSKVSPNGKLAPVCAPAQADNGKQAHLVHYLFDTLRRPPQHGA